MYNALLFKHLYLFKYLYIYFFYFFFIKIKKYLVVEKKLHIFESKN